MEKKSVWGPGLPSFPVHSLIQARYICRNLQAPFAVLGAEDPLENKSCSYHQGPYSTVRRGVTSAVMGKSRTVGTRIGGSEEWFPGEKDKVTWKIMPSGLKGK